MRRFLLIAVAAGAALLALAAPAGSALPNDITTVTGIFSADQSHSNFKLACPKGSVALGGAPVRVPSGVAVGRSVPGESTRSWLFSFSSQAPATVKAEVRCASVRFPGKKVHFQLGTSAAFETKVPAGSTLRLKLTCTTGLVPTGLGQDQTPVPGGGPRTPGAISIQSALPTERAFILRLRNDGTSTAEGDYHLRCLKRTVAGRDLDVSKLSFRDKLGDPGRIKHACKHGQSALTTGWVLPSGATTLRSSFLSSTRWGHWVFDQGQSRPRVKTTLLCLA
jgi:hypothetical protein